MAECAVESDSNAEALECPICLCKCLYPVKLPCTHTFCFLCIKGSFARNGRCALCRELIPLEFWDDPLLIKPPNQQDTEDKFGWFYEGRDGWWRYDELTEVEIESAFNDKLARVELLIAGQLYVVDLSRMTQYQRNLPSRRRRIKRDLIGAPKKGVAGLKLNSPVAAEEKSGEHPSQQPGGNDPPIEEALVESNSTSPDDLTISFDRLSINKHD